MSIAGTASVTVRVVTKNSTYTFSGNEQEGSIGSDWASNQNSHNSSLNINFLPGTDMACFNTGTQVGTECHIDLQIPRQQDPVKKWVIDDLDFMLTKLKKPSLDNDPILEVVTCNKKGDGPEECVTVLDPSDAAGILDQLLKLAIRVRDHGNRPFYHDW